MEDGDAELAPTRKRKFSKREVLELLKEKEGDLEKVVGCDELVLLMSQMKKSSKLMTDWKGWQMLL